MFTRCKTQSLGLGRKRAVNQSVAKERQRAERDQLTRLLKESPGKRDARNFLKHFDTPKPTNPTSTSTSTANADAKTGVNLGSLYEPTKAIQNNPVWTQQELPEKAPRAKDFEPLHLALVKLRQPQALDDETLGNLALTLSQMEKLGLNIVVVIDCDEQVQPDKVEVDAAWEAVVREQTSRVADALDEFNQPGAFAVHHALCVPDPGTDEFAGIQSSGKVEVMDNQLLFPPIEEGIIPVIPCFAYNAQLKKVRVHADDVVLALTREFAGITTRSSTETTKNEHDALYRKDSTESDVTVLDRIIILDPLGGIPSQDRADGAHVFINLEAEHSDVRRELLSVSAMSKPTPNSTPSLGAYNPISKFAESEIAPPPFADAGKLSGTPIPSRHVKNLDVAHQALRLLPPSSSALIITPEEAAISSQTAFKEPTSTGVRTRRSKNPLIHNLLTDKPMTSSSLPAPLVTRHLASRAPNPATFLKKGIPVTMVPDPRETGPWKPPSPSNPSIELENDPRINFPRLVDLIEDSFRRKLDVHHYLSRVRGRIAGVIIAGDYEGGAICTWEQPSSLSPNTPPHNPDLWVPYLDKFAVLTSSQGSGGVADIVWGALTRSAFPNGVVWRSRKKNPVNKWYFERSVGMWNLPDGYWTMFWTSEGVADEVAERRRAGEGNGVSRWDAYVDVCAGVKPSWSDGKTPD
ncbi:N-acetylglutamate synthase [Periconia macrospinosa]|uniref:Amino-acid acetyltransferase, mitochondrial n=1 Tax=Periconia macrospinosa TaxID=97972 RepID=A0A2V1E2Y5_9PLEO|nr:N-acetylglutamate synthase [Periconia macrospinosa]